MTTRELKTQEAKARRLARTLARDFPLPADATDQQVVAVMEAMRDEIGVGIRILQAVAP
jgi:hypothetical protein